MGPVGKALAVFAVGVPAQLTQAGHAEHLDRVAVLVFRVGDGAGGVADQGVGPLVVVGVPVLVEFEEGLHGVAVLEFLGVDVGAGGGFEPGGGVLELRVLPAQGAAVRRQRVLVVGEGHRVGACRDAVACAGHVVAASDIGDDGAGGGGFAVVKQCALDLRLAGAPVHHGAVHVGVVLLVFRLVLLGDLVGLVAVGDGLLQRLVVVRVVRVAGRKRRGERLEALREVEIDGVGVALALHDQMVEGVELIVLLGLHPRRVREHLELVVGQIELQLAHQAVAAQVGHLVILQDVDHVVTSVVLLHVVARTVVVAGDGEEDLVVFTDQLVPEVLAVLLGEVGGAITVDTRDLVRGEDHGQLRVLIDDLLRPLQRFVVGAETEREHQVLLPLGFEDVVLRVDALAREGVAVAARVDLRGGGAAHVGGVLLRALLREVLGEGGFPVEHGQVVVARQHGVVHPGVLERFHRAVRDIPAGAVFRLVHHVAQVGDKLRAQLLVVFSQELGLHIKRVGAVAVAEDVAGGLGAVTSVELGVRHDAEGEAGGEILRVSDGNWGEQGEGSNRGDVLAHGSPSFLEGR